MSTTSDRTPFGWTACSIPYPADYGFIPDTLAEDGDHLDILVLVQEPTFPGCVIEARPLGGLEMHDEKGSDFKVLAVPVGDPRYAHVATLEDLGEHWLREIETFFATYKLLEPKQTEVQGWHDARTALRVIAECRERYQQALRNAATAMRGIVRALPARSRLCRGNRRDARGLSRCRAAAVA